MLIGNIVALGQDRCDGCLSIRIPLSEEGAGQIISLTIKEDFRQLEESATQGCQLCQFFYRELVCATIDDISALYATAIPIHFDIDFSTRSNGFYLRCATLEVMLDVEYQSDDSWNFSAPLSISEQPLSESNYQQACSWIQQCNERHFDCVDQSLPLLPHRVIDVGSSDEDPIKLHVSNGDRDRYLTLSHCWGGTDHKCKLSLNVLEDWCQQIPQDIIPQTFLDAIEVSRKLKVRFLWIDSCCIIQPTREDDIDWRVEGSHMVDIYRNSYCNIAASAAINSDSGFLHPRLGTRFPRQKCSVGTDSSERPWVLLSPNRPQISGQIYSRGWVLQEELLPARCLHWTRESLHWTCCSHKASESSPVMESRSPLTFDFDPFPIENVVRKNGICERNLEVLSESFAFNRLLSTWKSIVQDFSARSLSIDSDRLAGIAGLAHAMSAYSLFSQTKYCAGLWEGMLFPLLCWSSHRASTNHPRRPTLGTYTAPTWSWASVIGRVIWEVNLHKVQCQFKIVEVETTPIQDPFGQIETNSGRLILKGRLQKGFHASVELPLCECCANEDVRDSQDWGGHVGEVVPSRPLLGDKAEIIWDVIPQSIDDPFYCFLYGDLITSDVYWQYALALRKKGGTASIFERVGWVCLGPTFEESFVGCDEETIVIV